jgi:hypothetical protein
MPENTTPMTAEEVRILADRLRARAISAFMIDAPSQQGDGLLASAALLHLVFELQVLREEVRRIAARCTDQQAQQALFDALTPRGPHHAGAITVRFND